jgi:hypothetical protein
MGTYSTPWGTEPLPWGLEAQSYAHETLRDTDQGAMRTLMTKHTYAPASGAIADASTKLLPFLPGLNRVLSGVALAPSTSAAAAARAKVAFMMSEKRDVRGMNELEC